MKIVLQRKNFKFSLKFFLSYFLIVIAAIIITSVIMSVIFQQILTRKIYTTQSSYLHNATYSMDDVYESIRSLSLQIYFDRDVSVLRNLVSPEVIDINTATNRLIVYGAIASHVQSIYIYNDISKTYYVSVPYGANRTFENAQFYDGAIRKILNSGEKNPMLYPISRNFPVIDTSSNITDIKGFTFLFYDPPMGIKPTEGAVVINVTDAWIQNIIGKYNSQLNDTTFIIDNRGEIILKSSDGNLKGNILDADSVGTILSSKNQSGYFIKNINGDRYLLIYEAYKPFEWVLVRAIPYMNIMGDVNSMRGRILSIGLLILFLGCIIVLVVSRKIYSPISSVLSRVSELEKENSNSFYVRKKEYLKNLILGSPENRDENILLNMKALQININPNGKYILLYLMIDHFDDFCQKYNVRDRELFKFAMINIASELCSEHFPNEGVDMGGDHVAMLLEIPEELLETHGAILEELIKKVQQSIKNTILLSVSAVISRVGQHLSSVTDLYGETQKISYDRFFFGHECILDYNMAQKKDYSEYKYPASKEKKLVEALMTGNISQAKTLYDEIVRYSLDYSYYTTRMTLLLIASAIYSALNTIKDNLGITFETDFERFVSELDRMESFDEVNEYFDRFFDSISSKLENKKSSKHQELLEHIFDIVEKGYRDSSLSLETIAKQVGMSSAYLGRLFSRLTAKSIVDYIHEVRINRAREMLTGTEKSVNEICTAVGYTNIQHFYKVFKRLSGVTPNEFRNNR